MKETRNPVTSKWYKIIPFFLSVVLTWFFKDCFEFSLAETGLCFVILLIGLIIYETLRDLNYKIDKLEQEIKIFLLENVNKGR